MVVCCVGFLYVTNAQKPQTKPIDWKMEGPHKIIDTCLASLIVMKRSVTKKHI